MERVQRDTVKRSSKSREKAIREWPKHLKRAKNLKIKVQKSPGNTGKRIEKNSDLNDDIYERTNEFPPHNDI